MERKYLDFEKPLEEIEKKILLFEKNKKNGTADKNSELIQFKQKLAEKKKDIFSNLSDWNIVQLARHPNRPHTTDYIEKIFEDFVELHGDRCFADDPAVVAGFGKFKGLTVGVIGTKKGRDLQENINAKFGMAHPEGYRKALRVMRLAEKLHHPVIVFIDTPGANPDIGAEERGQAFVIANNLLEMSMLRTPVLCIVTGEGGSGGALGLSVGDRIIMLQYSIYSVISPEGCASILWKGQSAVEEAAKCLKLTANSLLEMEIIDEVIPEPLGGAHSDWDKTFEVTSSVIEKNIREIKTINIDMLVDLRYEKYRKIGVFNEERGEADK